MELRLSVESNLELPRALDGADYGLRFVDRLLVLCLGDGVGSDAGAGLHVAFAVDGEHGAVRQSGWVNLFSAPAFLTNKLSQSHTSTCEHGKEPT